MHPRGTGRIISGAVVAMGALVALPSPAASATPCDANCQAITTVGGELVTRDGGPPGVIVLVDRGGSVATYSFGTSVVGVETPIAATDHLRLASVSKAFSGAVALSLVSQGKLRVTDTVGRWVKGLPTAWQPVTLAELLQHTSGIPDLITSPQFAKELPDRPYDPPSRLGLVRLAFPLDMRFHPGTRYEYSNTDNELVALMVQAVSDRSYEHELAALVTGPLGLDQTSLPQIEDVATPYAHGYQVRAGTPPDDVTNAFSSGWSWASGGMVSTPTDMDRFVRAYASGALVTQAVHARQFTFRPGSSGPPGPGTNSAGLGIFRYQTACGTVYGHTGNTLGYTQFAASSADGTRSAVVQVNAQITPTSAPEAFAQLQAVEGSAVCAALAS